MPTDAENGFPVRIGKSGAGGRGATISMTFGELLKRALAARGWSNAKFAREIGVTRATVGDWIKGRTHPRRENGPRIAAALNLPLSAIAPDPSHANVAFLDNSALTKRRVPLLDWANAGQGAEVVNVHTIGEATEFIETWFPVTDRAFALEVRGSSMEPVFHEGDIVVVDPAIIPSAGQFVIVELISTGEAPGPGEVTFKRYQPRGPAAFDLVPENPDYPAITINKTKPGRILGTVVEHRRSLIR